MKVKRRDLPRCANKRNYWSCWNPGIVEHEGKLWCRWCHPGLKRARDDKKNAEFEARKFDKETGRFIRYEFPEFYAEARKAMLTKKEFLRKK